MAVVALAPSRIINREAVKALLEVVRASMGTWAPDPPDSVLGLLATQIVIIAVAALLFGLAVDYTLDNSVDT